MPTYTAGKEVYAYTIATSFAVVLRLCHLILVSLSTLYLELLSCNSGLSNLWQMAGHSYFVLKLAGQYTNNILLDYRVGQKTAHYTLVHIFAKY